MEDKKRKTHLFALYGIILALLIVCITLYIKVSQNAKKTVIQTIELRDTICIKDTMIKYKTKEVEVVKYDTIEIREKDTIKIPIPISRYTYKDTIRTDTSRTEIRIDFEGYNAKIDSIQLFQEFHPSIEILAPKEKKVNFGQCVVVGVHVGYGVGFQPNRQYGFEPYIGVGITYGFGINWRK